MIRPLLKFVKSINSESIVISISQLKGLLHKIIAYFISVVNILNKELYCLQHAEQRNLAQKHRS